MVKEVPLGTRGARAKLKARGKPYFRQLDKGLHLGYRKSEKSGAWLIRRYLGTGSYEVETFGLADDNRNADGIEVLTYQQAEKIARGMAEKAAGGSHASSPGGVTRTTEIHAARDILPVLGHIPLADLKTTD